MTVTKLLFSCDTIEKGSFDRCFQFRTVYPAIFPVSLPLIHMQAVCGSVYQKPARLKKEFTYPGHYAKNDRGIFRRFNETQ